MKINKLLIFQLLLFIAITVSCGPADKQAPRVSKDNLASTKVEGNDYHFIKNYSPLKPANLTPFTFIDLASKNYQRDSSLNVITMFNDFPADWIKESYIDSLILLLESKEKCSCFLNPYSSFLPVNEYAEIGGFAMKFVEAYKKGQKIDLGRYQCPKADQQKVQELQDWWIKRKLEFHVPCPSDRIATGKSLKQRQVNDSTEQLFLNDSLWFEIIGVNEYDQNTNISYLKLYRVNGLLEEEGSAIYFDHPIVDFSRHGEWKFYDCEGNPIQTKLYNEGQLVNTK